MSAPKINFDSPEWQKVREWLQVELLEAYKSLASTHRTEKECDVLRGRAGFIDILLGFKNAADNQPLGV